MNTDQLMALALEMAGLTEIPGDSAIYHPGDGIKKLMLGIDIKAPELKIAVINPIAVEDNKSPAWTEEDAATGDYILLVREMPEMFVCEARELEFYQKTIKKRMGNKCVYSTETAQKEE